MNEAPKSSTILLYLLGFYAFPLFGLILYTEMYLPMGQTWILLPVGLICVSVGCLAIYSLMRRLEQPIVHVHSADPEPMPAPAPFVQAAAPMVERIEQPSQELLDKIETLQAANNQQKEDIDRLSRDNERYQRQAELVLQEFAQFKKAAQEEIEQKGTQVADNQQKIAEQKAILEKKQHVIGQLEIKVQDLSYEIKTLLQLAEIGNPKEHRSKPASFNEIPLPDLSPDQAGILEPLVFTPQEAQQQLKRCIDMAQKITASSSMRTSELGSDQFTLDHRRLFDSLRSETGAAILLYSQKENKLLFANQQCKQLLGWSSDKVVQLFPEIVQPGKEEWQTALTQLATEPEARVQLSLKAKTGSDVSVQGVIGTVPTGLFKHHAVAVLFNG